ncbi:MAG: molybdenum ABC transporter ATP-binding protein [endosymbiont of Galathealinum brachiosum]|uniref:Molybdenum ABC transporter ATP-binding protein n=1 Tax=endosymbiont of Galathealinum brachiosum TaxID=2200906 RepID=A0A370DCL4_9GAMM|nr:MAG: molybdenum ABC transporter ATP-binding protein [endosymbiont of Galathealinum brachiosum]
MIRIKYKKRMNEFLLDVDFKMPEKGVTVLFGPSGSGKTSVLNLMAGLNENEENIQQSEFSLNGKIIDDLNNKINIEPWLRNVAYVFQDHRLFPHMTTEENILFGYKRRKSELNPDELVEKFKIKELLNHRPDQLSGGQKQRVAMVRALLSQPELIILDEPLSALDYQSRQELLPYIECIHKELNIPMIYVSHDIKEVLRLADYIVVMDKGNIIDQGDIADLCITQPLLTQEEGASFILKGTVSKIITEDKLVQLDCGENILITAENMQLDQKLRILIHARDVSLCLSQPKDSSILNCIPIIIDELQTDKNGKLRVMAKIGKQTMVSLISHRSAHQLNIEKGKKMFAQFKATAMIK